jgi:GTP cyclohydrolase I
MDDNALNLMEAYLDIIWPEWRDDPQMYKTPERMARMYTEFFDIEEPAATLFTAEHDELVILSDIQFSSLCAHHFLPFEGVVHVGYLPQGKIIGLSKIPRIVKFLSRRPQTQETFGTQIADYLLDIPDFEPAGVGVLVQARHTCMSFRGAEAPGITTTTSALRGSFKDDATQRAEFLSLVHQTK